MDRIGDRTRQQRRGDVVLAGGKAHRQLVGGPSVQLGRPTGAGPLAAGESAELRGEQAVGDEPVEMEPGDRAGDAQRLGRLVLAHGLTAADDEPVERAALRFGQRRDTGDAGVEIGGHREKSRHPEISKKDKS